MIGPTLLLFASLLTLRYQVTQHLSLSWSHALATGAMMGVLADLAAALLPLPLAQCLSRSKRVWAWIAVAFFVWLANVSHVNYYRFFESRLDWWMVSGHIRDLLWVKGAITDLLRAVPIVVSTVIFIFAVWTALRTRHEQRSIRPTHRLARAGFSFLLILWVHQSPVWFGMHRVYPPSVVNQQILAVWWKQIRHPETTDALQIRGLAGTPIGSQGPLATLAKYRGTLSDPPPTSLLTRFEPSATVTRTLRERLGLASDSRPNVILLFLESARAYDLLHPEIGPKVFPELRKILDHHGILFTQAYANGQMTVNGHLSSQCSVMSNLLGPPAYVDRLDLRVRCIQETVKANGYSTHWIAANPKTFHNSDQWESRHGTDHLFDIQYFHGKGLKERVGDWGVADHLMLTESVNLLREQKAKDGKPFFASITTISTHTPFSVVPNGPPLPADLMKATQATPEYQGYLSRFRYADQALGKFFQQLFASELGDQTVVFLVADHGTGVRPHLYLKSGRVTELWHRIPLAIISKKMKSPEKINHPVSQIDIPPTIAELTGSSGDVTWMGRSLLSGAGSPWVGLPDHIVAYRTRDRACFPEPGESQSRCWDTSNGGDPLFQQDLPELPVDPVEMGYFGRVILATHQAISLNLFSGEPPARSPAH